jgi:methylmalonyl-CoA mutase
MAASAWGIFQQIEAEGGMIESLMSGRFQQDVEKVRLQKNANIQKRKDVIVGTNTYPNATEELPGPADIDYAAIAKQLAERIAAWKNKRDNSALFTVLDGQIAAKGTAKIDAMISGAEMGATLHELQNAAGLGTLLQKAQPIPLNRAASDYEALRKAAIRLAVAGNKPILHQLNMGPSRRYRMRADWTSAFFQVAGFSVLNEDDYDTVEDALEALRQSGAAIAVITSDDETYQELAASLAGRIKAACSETILYLAGTAGENEAEWEQAGIDGYVNVRTNNYELNRHLLQALGAEISD